MRALLTMNGDKNKTVKSIIIFRIVNWWEYKF